jgi:molybdopterin converting factor small subunit
VTTVDQHGVGRRRVDERAGLGWQDLDVVGEQGEGWQHLDRGLRAPGEQQQVGHRNLQVLQEEARAPRRGLVACTRIRDVSGASPDGDDHTNVVTVRYWAAVRSAAGVAEEQVDARTLADLHREILHRHRDSKRFADVLAICSTLVGSVPVGAREPSEVTLSPGDTVELLPPFAGG